ncbi:MULTISPECIES: hypothetical protein [Paenibacillus]|uniref:hypothetical protein n=1 Tax=Paenibacillus TaxID=44249 RepID=UPI0022B88F77|nr:hypothetical protein [Paenibacillus caseinilyticus]MCZ8521578.1 hypothetical protein [Paenibacillus caseinilyticus]
MQRLSTLHHLRRAVAVIAVVLVVGFLAAKLLQGRTLGGSDLISIPIVLTTLFNVFAWNSSEEKLDERGVSIAKESASISYYVLLAVLLLLVVIGEWTARGSGELHNVPLFAALCIAMVLQPCIAWWRSRQYR